MLKILPLTNVHTIQLRVYNVPDSPRSFTHRRYEAGSQNSDMSNHDPDKKHNVFAWTLDLTVKARSTVLSSAKVTVLYFII